MRAALSAARECEGATAPNPPVGCALLDASGKIITTAAHHGAGQLHAEALAIKQARELGRVNDIHTVVVTLEPCNHHGRTPPCTEAILATPAKSVIIGARDPNPKVTGGGAALLHAKGIEVVFAESTELQRLIAPFRKVAKLGLPWLTVKQAINLQGTMIPPQGEKTFTSPASLNLAHQLRRRADAIITGSGTILADDPHFTVRNVEDFPNKRRKLILFDRRRRVPQAYVDAATARGFTIEFHHHLGEALHSVVAGGGLEVLVEAGPLLTAHVLASPFWDEHVRISQTAGTEYDGDKIDHVLRNH
ncbi:bifunctional diaminohydroxyphosphoribosylaminopyrimidine deaminase/5-amino-6-(5-phosphoribosylamino)uracil reductase RibD [Aestuariivirga litoralis]|nr:bifunctional diaminohydroxyphosphoribosylaminopyrimidine deaminase/5-amino-6-(5-phosphoribosylamino)uracil reductase RibD [Aestuariivirga litoralis]MBG1232087.1 bifunctional diaminohydroxyphosphoribosylaminopyrimidine deaminase/5-amino-6-(5-phosphoribosylamino)uracil reductase RibD [Aestuariivirga litoralis]